MAADRVCEMIADRLGEMIADGLAKLIDLFDVDAKNYSTFQSAAIFLLFSVSFIAELIYVLVNFK